jgi:hypothetical protein
MQHRVLVCIGDLDVAGGERLASEFPRYFFVSIALRMLMSTLERSDLSDAMSPNGMTKFGFSLKQHASLPPEKSPMS